LRGCGRISGAQGTNDALIWSFLESFVLRLAFGHPRFTDTTLFPSRRLQSNRLGPFQAFLKYLAVTYAVCPISQFRFICGRVEADKPACGAANKRILIIINPTLLFETSCFGM
jgi:hypothetical protein